MKFKQLIIKTFFIALSCTLATFYLNSTVLIEEDELEDDAYTITVENDKYIDIINAINDKLSELKNKDISIDFQGSVEKDDNKYIFSLELAKKLMDLTNQSINLSFASSNANDEEMVFYKISGKDDYASTTKETKTKILVAGIKEIKWETTPTAGAPTPAVPPPPAKVTVTIFSPGSRYDAEYTKKFLVFAEKIKKIKNLSAQTGKTKEEIQAETLKTFLESSKSDAPAGMIPGGLEDEKVTKGDLTSTVVSWVTLGAAGNVTIWKNITIENITKDTVTKLLEAANKFITDETTKLKDDEKNELATHLSKLKLKDNLDTTQLKEIKAAIKDALEKIDLEDKKNDLKSLLENAYYFQSTGLTEIIKDITEANFEESLPEVKTEVSKLRRARKKEITKSATTIDADKIALAVTSLNASIASLDTSIVSLNDSIIKLDTGSAQDVATAAQHLATIAKDAAESVVTPAPTDVGTAKSAADKAKTAAGIADTAAQTAKDAVTAKERSVAEFNRAAKAAVRFANLAGKATEEAVEAKVDASTAAKQAKDAANESKTEFDKIKADAKTDPAKATADDKKYANEALESVKEFEELKTTVAGFLKTAGEKKVEAEKQKGLAKTEIGKVTAGTNVPNDAKTKSGNAQTTLTNDVDDKFRNWDTEITTINKIVSDAEAAADIANIKTKAGKIAGGISAELKGKIEKLTKEAEETPKRSYLKLDTTTEKENIIEWAKAILSADAALKGKISGIVNRRGRIQTKMNQLRKAIQGTDLDNPALRRLNPLIQLNILRDATQ